MNNEYRGVLIMHKSISVYLLVAAAATVLSASQQEEFTNAQPDSAGSPKKTQLLSSRKEPPMPMPLVAPLFVEDGARTSVITMVSDSSTPLTVDVVLLGTVGNQITKRSITINPHSDQTVSVSDLLADVSYHPALYGSILLVPERASTMAAQLSIIDRRGDAATADMEEEFVMLMGTKPANYRAVINDASLSPLLAIRSLSPIAQTVAISCIRDQFEKGETLSLAPYQLLLVHTCSSKSRGKADETRPRSASDQPSVRPAAVSVFLDGSLQSVGSFRSSPPCSRSTRDAVGHTVY